MSQIRANGEIDDGQTEPAVTGNRVPDLRFNSYQGDPVARLVIDRFRLTPFKFALVMLGVTTLIYGLAAVGYAAFYSSNALPEFLDWARRSWAQMLSYAVPPVILGLYLRLSIVPGRLFDGLVKDGIVEASDARLREMVIDGKRSFREMYSRRIWGVISLIVSAAFVAVILLQDNFGQGPKEDSGSIMTLFESLMLPLRALLFNSIGMMAATIAVTVRSLGSLFGATTLNLRPFDPDGCGGLGRIYDFNMVVNYVIATAGLGVSLQAYLTYVWSGVFNWAEDYPLFILLAGYMVLAPYGFFATLGTAHRAMLTTCSSLFVVMLQSLGKGK